MSKFAVVRNVIFSVLLFGVSSSFAADQESAQVITKLPALLRKPGRYVLVSDLQLTRPGPAIRIIGRGITLDGQGHSISSANSRSFNMVVQKSSDVSIENLTVLKNGHAVEGSVRVDRSSAVSISNCTIGELTLSVVSDSTIQSNSILRSVILRNSRKNVINDNSLNGSFVSLQLSRSNDNLLKNNFIRSISVYPAGIGLYRSSNNSLDRNIILSNAIGIAITSNSAGNRLTNNTVQGGYRALTMTAAVKRSVSKNNIFMWTSTLPGFRGVKYSRGTESDYNNYFYLGQEMVALHTDRNTATVSQALTESCKVLRLIRRLRIDQNSLCTDPLLVDRAGDDVNLQSTSPMIDAGDPSFGSDYLGGRIDIGALEYAPVS